MIDVRRVTDSDIENIADLENEIFTDAWSINGLLESLRQEYVVMLGAWTQDKIIGYLIFYVSIDEGEIVRIAVDEQYRRQGVASRLISELDDICKARQIGRICLEVRESNMTAIEFYKKHGFVKDGIRKNFYTKPTENAVLMSLELGK